MRVLVSAAALVSGIALCGVAPDATAADRAGPAKVGARRAAPSKAVEGTVTEFTEGKVLTVTTHERTACTYWLDDRSLLASLDNRLAVGAEVRVVEGRDARGNRTLTVTVLHGSTPARRRLPR